MLAVTYFHCRVKIENQHINTNESTQHITLSLLKKHDSEHKVVTHLLKSQNLYSINHLQNALKQAQSTETLKNLLQVLCFNRGLNSTSHYKGSSHNNPSHHLHTYLTGHMQRFIQDVLYTKVLNTFNNSVSPPSLEDRGRRVV